MSTHCTVRPITNSTFALSPFGSCSKQELPFDLHPSSLLHLLYSMLPRYHRTRPTQPWDDINSRYAFTNQPGQDTGRPYHLGRSPIHQKSHNIIQPIRSHESKTTTNRSRRLRRQRSTRKPEQRDPSISLIGHPTHKEPHHIIQPIRTNVAKWRPHGFQRRKPSIKKRSP